MKNDVKLEISLERDIKSRKETMNELELEENFELGLKITNNKREDKRILIQENVPENKIDINQNYSLEYKNKLRKDLNNTGNKVNLKKHYKNNNKRINTNKNIYIIIIIFFNLIIQNNNKIENKFSNITLKIRGPGEQNILNEYYFNHFYKPNIIYINGNFTETITYRYNLSRINNSVSLIWNNTIYNCYRMFHGCSNIIEIDLSNFNTSKVTDMNSMFLSCSHLISLDLSNFDTSNVYDMRYMFSVCSQLTSLDLSNFVTSKVKYIFSMFDGCSQLTSLNLSNFDTSKVTDMSSMFSGCSQLTSLDLSYFDTSKVIDMSSMFSRCSKLTLLDLSHFDTSKVTDMRSMFRDCSQLTLLDLSHFDTSNVTDMSSMFQGCSQLEYINLKNFSETVLCSYDAIFNNVADNTVVCLNENSIHIVEELKIINCYTLDCSNNWKINQKKLVHRADLCFDNSNNNILFNYEYQGLYYEDCKNGNLTNNNIINYCKCNTKCSDCIYYYYFDNFNNYYCTKNKSCPAEYPILNEIECKKNNIKDMIENVINNTQIKKEEEINYYNAFLKSFEDIYTSKNFYTHNIDNGNDEIIEMEKVKVILTTSENQKKI